MATQREVETTTEIKSGYLLKQGGKYRNWKKRYFVLSGTTVQYYVNKGDVVAKGQIDLSRGRGVRKRHQCSLKWPKDAKNGLCFGISTEGRTYYLYGTDKSDIVDWMEKLQQEIQKVGKPTDEWKNDPEGSPEGAVSKAVRRGTKLASQLSRKIKDTGLVDEDTADVISSAADAVENQADAGRDATISDRLKTAAGDSAGIVGDNVDSEIVKTAANVAQEQAEADEDASLQQRVLMGAGTTLEGASEMTDNDIASGVLGTAGGVAKDQAEADEDMSLKQRAVLAGGSALSGASEMVDNEVVASAMEVGGSTAEGVADLKQFKYDSDVQKIADGISKTAESLQDDGERSSSSSSSSEDEN